MRGMASSSAPSGVTAGGAPRRPARGVRVPGEIRYGATPPAGATASQGFATPSRRVEI